MTADTYLLRGKRWMERLRADPRLRRWAPALARLALGFLLSGGGLLHRAQPFAVGLISALDGSRALMAALGSIAGYRIYWGSGGDQGVVWSVLTLITVLILNRTGLPKKSALLVPAFCGLWAAVSGLVFLLLGDDTATVVYLARIVLAFGSSLLMRRMLRQKHPACIWTFQAILVLALTQAVPLKWLNPGIMLSGAMAASGAFPAAALGGLALDLSRVTPVPMTGILCAACFARLVPGLEGRKRYFLPAGAYLLLSALWGRVDPAPVPALLAGGLLSALLPRKTDTRRRRGHTGTAQVRLETAAEALNQCRQLILETEEVPIDEEALLARTKERACGSCPNRKNCRIPDALPRELLHRPLTENTDLPFTCRKSGRMALELRRSQEQYRFLSAQLERRREYRSAVQQQYGFLSAYLRSLSDTLPQSAKIPRRRFRPAAAVAAVSREADNGDKCLHFYGPGCSYYLLLCDGMGTGIGASQEGRTAAEILKRLLTAGFPAGDALDSLNSLLTLRGLAGAVSVDLAQVQLDTGKVILHKWGAAPSLLLKTAGAEKIGTAGPPPGIGVTDTRKTAQRLSLRHGEALILLSDGVDGEEARRWAVIDPEQLPGEMAAKLLEVGAADSKDDATVAVLRLYPENLST